MAACGAAPPDPSSRTLSDPDPEPRRAPLWQWPLLANLMAPAVACAWLAGLAVVYKVYVPPLYFVLLAAATWTVQAIDGLLDGWQPSDTRPQSPRARFHRRHRAWFLVLIPCVSVAGLLLAATQATSTLVVAAGGLSVLVCLILLHAQAVRSASWTPVPTEAMAGALFAVGTMLPVLDLRGRFPFADPAGLAMAVDNGIPAFLRWLGLLVLETVGATTYEPATWWLVLLFTTNRLLSTAHATPGRGTVDPGPAKPAVPLSVRLAPWLAALLACGGLALAWISPQASSRLFLFLAGLCAGLMFVVHLLARMGVLPAGVACLLLDCALLAPIGLLGRALHG